MFFPMPFRFCKFEHLLRTNFIWHIDNRNSSHFPSFYKRTNSLSKEVLSSLSGLSIKSHRSLLSWEPTLEDTINDQMKQMPTRQRRGGQAAHSSSLFLTVPWQASVSLSTVIRLKSCFYRAHPECLATNLVLWFSTRRLWNIPSCHC